MVKSRVGAIAMAIAMGATACGFEGETSDAATESLGIYDGVNLSASELNASGLVAVYHPKLPDFPNFFPRPCSGVIVRSEGGLSTVLTARHCVTTNGAWNGTLVDPSALRLSPTLSPGPALPNPPPDAVTAFYVTDKQGNLEDVAVVFVPADWSSIANNRIGLYVGDPHNLVSQQFTGYGYGINVADGSCNTDNSTAGAGVARSGAFFTVTNGYLEGDGQPSEYAHTAVSTGGQAIYCGDSGGPDEMVGGQGRVLLGVHSTGATTLDPVYSTAFDLGLQNTLGLLLRPASAAPDAWLAEDPATGNVQIVGAGGPYTTVSYDVSSKLLWMNGRCVSATSSFWPPSIAHLATCNSLDPTELWGYSRNGQLVNPITGKCLNVSSSGVGLAACVVTLNGRSFRPSSTLWTFRAQL